MKRYEIIKCQTRLGCISPWISILREQIAAEIVSTHGWSRVYDAGNVTWACPACTKIVEEHLVSLAPPIPTVLEEAKE